MSVTERPLQTPCEWCGRAVAQPPTGRLLRYCDRSCRQRAYEARTAKRRLQDDVDTGRVRAQPAERIVERVVRAKYPSTAAGWEKALDELRAQLADGRIGPWNAPRIDRAIAAVDEQLQAIETAAVPRPRPSRETFAVDQPPAAAAVPFAGERLAVIEARIAAAGGTLSTTLEHLAGDVGIGVDELRQAMLEFERLGFLAARRRGTVVPVDELAVHSRFELCSI
ncbi:hypothetical protein [Mangrovihabitans endophyticus]|uniref:Uncharacterized protein n=1 Tax=Mangrovihabitans endophyticus TaxID=1751298 RepID=A0A8J3C5F8_9ACTN|nr:hypothetical protein [Mangrovihabitans endophyticus]GGL17742.1 hypothetical protein GCM10012284_60420 [Mangrovihabitans endophyticus]